MKFSFTHQNEAGQETELTVEATYYPGFTAPYPEPDESASMEIGQVCGPDGTPFEADDETLAAIEEKAWEEFEKQEDAARDAREAGYARDAAFRDYDRL